MAQKVTGIIKLQINAAKATASPPYLTAPLVCSSVADERERIVHM